MRRTTCRVQRIGPWRLDFRLKLDLCLTRLRDDRFAHHVWTDDLTVRNVADRVARTAGLALRPNTDTRVRGYLRRSWTSLRHIRLD